MTRERMDPDVALFVLRRDGGCMGPRLGGSFMDCFGRDRIEHVQLGYGRTGRRAAHCPCSTLTLCEGHTEPGMKAGYVWATDHKNRDRCREHLASLGYGPHVEGHAALILSRSLHASHVDPCGPTCRDGLVA